MKLTYQQFNKYYINRKKAFKGRPINNKYVHQTIHFSLEMVLGDGHHRSHRSGGLLYRNTVEQLANTFQGKLAEFIVFEELTKNGFNPEYPDLEVYGKGTWDTVDVVCNNYSINIKSCAFYSNLLLLEKADWNSKGEYIPNLNLSKKATYDFFVLVRLSPDIKRLLYQSNLQISPTYQTQLVKLLSELNYTYDFGGVCSNKTLKHIVNHEYILPQNALLNGHLKMDACNYYIQTGNLINFSWLLSQLEH